MQNKLIEAQIPEKIAKICLKRTSLFLEKYYENERLKNIHNINTNYDIQSLIVSCYLQGVSDINNNLI